MRYTTLEMESILESVGFPDVATGGQILRMLWWSFFNQKKLDNLLDLIRGGFSFREAYRKVTRYDY